MEKALVILKRLRLKEWKCVKLMFWRKKRNKKVISILLSVFYWSCLVFGNARQDLAVEVWNDRMVIKYGFIMQKTSVGLLFSLYEPLNTFFLSAFRRRVSREAWRIFWEHCSTSSPLWRPHPQRPISHLHKRFLLSCHPCLIFPLTAHGDDIIPSHMASSCSTFHNTHTRVRYPHSKSSRAISYRREQKPSSLSYRPTVVLRGPPLAWNSHFSLKMRACRALKC